MKVKSEQEPERGHPRVWMVGEYLQSYKPAGLPLIMT